MRSLRYFKPGQCCHLIVAADTREAFGGARRSRAESRRPSRIANRAFFLDDEEKTRFIDRLWRVAAFPGAEVLAYCLMSNHFHLLVYVPNPRELHEKSIRLVLREFEDERLARRVKKGLSVNDEKQQKARQREFARFELLRKGRALANA